MENGQTHVGRATARQRVDLLRRWPALLPRRGRPAYFGRGQLGKVRRVRTIRAAGSGGPRRLGASRGCKRKIVYPRSGFAALLRRERKEIKRLSDASLGRFGCRVGSVPVAGRPDLLFKNLTTEHTLCVPWLNS